MWCALVAAMALLGVADPAAALPVTGSLVPLATPSACFTNTATVDCSTLGLGLTLQGPGPVAVSEDGADVYVGNLGHGDTVAFSRDAGGKLTPLGGLSAVTDTDDMQFLISDGMGVFAAVADNDAVNGAVDAYARQPDGTLVAAPSVADNCDVPYACVDVDGNKVDDDNGLADVYGLALAPDGSHLYAVAGFGGGGNAGALTVFSRDPQTQALTEVQCLPAASARAARARSPLLCRCASRRASPSAPMAGFSTQPASTPARSSATRSTARG
jgi:hypothetical protein